MYVAAAGSPAGAAQAHAAQMAGAPGEADYAYVRAYLFAYGWPVAEAVYGEDVVRAAMLPEEDPR